MISNNINWNETIREKSKNQNGKKEEHTYIQSQEDHQIGTAFMVLLALTLTTNNHNNNKRINFYQNCNTGRQIISIIDSRNDFPNKHEKENKQKKVPD